MRSKCTGALLLGATIAFAQAPAEPFPPEASVKQLMLDLIHPSSNDILLAIYRGGPKDEKEWAAVRRSAVTMAESGNLLMMRGRARDQGDWMKDAKLLVDAGNAAYKAAQAKDSNALAALAGAVDASCTTCHKQYRPNVFPLNGFQNRRTEPGAPQAPEELALATRPGSVVRRVPQKDGGSK